MGKVVVLVGRGRGRRWYEKKSLKESIGLGMEEKLKRFL